MRPLRVLDLFSGIGGFSLGLEATGGFKTVAFCEIDPYCQKVLRQHWPNVPVYPDVRTITRETIQADVLCGGFPCQDISIIGRGVGISGERSGLWKAYAAAVGHFRPRLVLVENVGQLTGRGLGVVLGDLARLGYDAEWHCFSAAAIGARHLRERTWIVAYPNRSGLQGHARHGARSAQPEWHPANQGRSVGEGRICPHPSAWNAEPRLGRVADGVPNRVDRIKSLGNAVVPQVVEVIGRACLAAGLGR